MSQVVALYRFPVKGFTPEICRALTMLDEGRIAGDRPWGMVGLTNFGSVQTSWLKVVSFISYAWECLPSSSA
ncbi:MAG: MOSC N-terminal beta barrel domain-containing protein [Methylococcales bacterium]|nr:MOSC N-terminal beta barrel domain-containing protein [Methylococcales bacterium]